jgi:hypothetical protein
MTECRRICRGEGFDHDPTVMSIATAGETLRCPICRKEVGLSGKSSDATPRVNAPETGVHTPD